MKILKITCMAILVVSLSFFAYAEEVKRNAKVIELNGKVELRVQGKGKWTPLEAEAVIDEGDVIRTRKNSWALIELDKTGETASVELKENSKLKLAELVKDSEKGTQSTLLDLVMGEVLIKAKKLHKPDSKFEVKTPTSIVGVRGTEFSVRVEALD